MAEQLSQVDKAVVEGGAYEVIRARLEEQANTLKTNLDALNNARIAEFGQANLEVTGRSRIRTENNCVARDIVPVGQHVLFGYNVFIGLKKETKVADVFGLYQLREKDSGFELDEQPIDKSFLDDPSFVSDFNELYTYYKEARLIQLKVQNQTLFAVFQIGRKLDDIRVFQWRVNKDGSASYIDNRGERAIKKAASHDFEWTQVTRDMHVTGSHPHISILDKVFVETINGDLTIKIEDNTEDGRGIYNEAVEDKTQSLGDAEMAFAEVGTLILLKILPYREKESRYLVYNTRTETVTRIDAIGLACISLPEDHGIIFPGGYYLQNGDHKSFPDQIEGLNFKRTIRSPNGEDVLYVFYEPESGLCALYSYNVIRKTLQNPIYAHGYSVFEDGTMVVFNAEDEPTRVHPMQIWETPFFSEEHAAGQPTNDTFYSRIGNKELVRGISDFTSITKAATSTSPSRNLYEDLIKSCKAVFDSYHWLNEPEVNGLGDDLSAISQTAELVIDEFDKVTQIRAQATTALKEAEEQQSEIEKNINISSWKLPEEYIGCLGQLRRQRGHLITLKDQRYIDLDRIAELDEALAKHFDEVSQATVRFLSSDKSLSPYLEKIAELENTLKETATVVEITPITDELEKLSIDLDVLTEMLNGLKVEDATVRTKILDDISEIYAKLNQVKAQAKQHRKQLGSGEATAEFAAQFRLFSQSITSALSMADTPEKADEQLARLLIQLEELESKFSEFDQFLDDIVNKREELHSAFESRKQSLLEDQQRRAQNLFSAAERILKGVARRAGKFSEPDELNTYFASDPMILKLSDLVAQLRELNDQVKADEVEAQLKSAKEQGIRSLRDKQDIFEDGGAVIKLGKHKFSVNSQGLDLTLIAKDDGLYRHLAGTDYYEVIEDETLESLKPYWQQALISENDKVSRVEYLCASIIDDATRAAKGLTLDKLYSDAKDDKALGNIVKSYIAERYQEGYEKGVHDHDATILLKSLLEVHAQAGLLRYSPLSRALAMLFWQFSGISEEQKRLWSSHAISAQVLSSSFNHGQGFAPLEAIIKTAIEQFVSRFKLPFDEQAQADATSFMALTLAQDKPNFVISKSAQTLAEQLKKTLADIGHQKTLTSAFKQFNELINAGPDEQGHVRGLSEKWLLTHAWLTAMISQKEDTADKQHYADEATALFIADKLLPTTVSKLDLTITASGLLSEHKNIQDGEITLSLDEYLERLSHFIQTETAQFKRYHALRHQYMEDAKSDLQLDAYAAKPLSSFVRNRLIDEVYLSIIGDNLAKQMGTVGDNKRTDLMGLLLLISPPGYGKTTLMEYVADRLGLVFMKINCPSLGHDVTSIDPNNAPNATARQELEKLNLGLEMGNNVMLYLDDIQHTHPEFLQKFISLCDGTRRIEGVWRGQSKTYDMRGKKFCVVMAGNPYTESGDVFKVPDMLANRADIYNLGDVLGGKEEQFALSYIENCLTSNPVLAPLALRDMKDVHRFIAMAKGEEVATTELSHQYSGAEISEITAVLKHLLAIQQVILKVNLQYIESAATAEDYRTEPPFKLQGSYRNMNKMAEKVSAVMNHDELMQLIGDHYVGEAQTLTSGAEENLLKLAQLRGVMSKEQTERWAQICSVYSTKQQRDVEGDPAEQAVRQLASMADALEAIKVDMQSENTDNLIKPINRVAAAMLQLSKTWEDTGDSEEEK